MVHEKLPKEIVHLKGFFSKATAGKLPPSHLGFNMVLDLAWPLKGKPKNFPTLQHLLSLEKEHTDELLRLDFIEKSMFDRPASTLFVDKKEVTDKRWCMDYRWVNEFLTPRLVPTPDVAGTLTNCRNARHLTKIDIIRAFNRLLISPESRYLTSFCTRQGTFQWKVLPFGLKTGPAWW